MSLLAFAVEAPVHEISLGGERRFLGGGHYYCFIIISMVEIRKQREKNSSYINYRLVIPALRSV